MTIQQGHLNYPLTEQGQQQAREVGLRLAGTKWSRVYSSDLTRAADTADLILEQEPNTSNRCVPIRSPLIREYSFGIREGMGKLVTLKQAKAEVAKLRNVSVDEIVDTSETPEDVSLRTIQMLQCIFNDLFGGTQQKEKPSLGTIHTTEEVTEAAAVGVVTYDTANSQSATTGCLSLSSDCDTGAVLSGDSRPKVLCVSHGGFIKSFLRKFCTGLEIPASMENCSVSTVIVEWPLGSSGGEDFTCSTTTADINKVS